MAAPFSRSSVKALESILPLGFSRRNQYRRHCTWRYSVFVTSQDSRPCASFFFALRSITITCSCGLNSIVHLDLIIQLVHTWARLIATLGMLVRVYQLVTLIVLNDERRRAHAANKLLCVHLALLPDNRIELCAYIIKPTVAHIRTPCFAHCCLLHQPLRKGAAGCLNPCLCFV